MNIGEITSPVVQCSSANCQWPIVPTIGACGLCVNKTSTVRTRYVNVLTKTSASPSGGAELEDSPLLRRQTSVQNCTYSIPGQGANFSTIRGSGGTFEVNSSVCSLKEVNVLPFGNSLLYLDMFLAFDASGTKVPGVQVELYAGWLCMEALNISMTNDKQSEQVVAEWNMTAVDDSNGGGYYDYAMFQWINCTDLSPETFKVPENITFGVTLASDQALMEGSGQFTDNTITIETNTGTSSAMTQGELGTPYIYSYNSNLVKNLFAVSNYQAWIDQYTLSLTNHFHKMGTSTTPDSYYAGYALVEQIYVHIRRPWLAYPAALVMASTLLLIGTI